MGRAANQDPGGAWAGSQRELGKWNLWKVDGRWGGVCPPSCAWTELAVELC